MMVVDLDDLEEDHNAFTNNPIRSYFYKLFTETHSSTIKTKQ